MKQESLGIIGMAVLIWIVTIFSIVNREEESFIIIMISLSSLFTIVTSITVYQIEKGRCDYQIRWERY